VSSRRPLFRLPFRATLVPIVLYAVVLGTMEMASLLLRHKPLDSGKLAEFNHLTAGTQVALWILITLAYAGARTSAFHPTVSPSYAGWLATTPWRPAKPLPLGPAALVWEDAVPATAVALMSPRPELSAVAFAAVYALYAVRVSAGGRDGRWVAATFGLSAGGIVRLWPAAEAIAAVSVGLVFASDVAVRRSLADVVWTRPVAAAARLAVNRRRQSGSLLTPVEPPAPLPALTGWTIAVVLAWCVYAVSYQGVAADASNGVGCVGVAVAVLMFVSLIRLARYVGRYQPPISTLGRLRTGRLIVPGYDIVFVAPTLGMALALAMPMGLYLAGASAPLAAAAGTLAVLAVVLLLGPTRRRWDLTGHHRIVPRGSGQRAPGA
jgi:hypothetical protein